MRFPSGLYLTTETCHSPLRLTGRTVIYLSDELIDTNILIVSFGKRMSNVSQTWYMVALTPHQKRSKFKG